jgi:hypothetical protein
MFRDVVVLMSCGTVIYLWLCLIVSPLATSLRSVIRKDADRTAWMAFALAAGGAILWTAIVAGSVVLGMVLEPQVGLRLLGSDAGWRGVSLGLVVWGGQLVASARAPRIGGTFETATALAIVAFVKDDPRTLSRVERLYRAHAIAQAPGHAVRLPSVRRIAA